MGWIFKEAEYYKPKGEIDRKAECDALCVGKSKAFKVLKSAMVGTIYYAAVKQYKKYVNGVYISIPEDKQIVFGMVILTSVNNKDIYNFGYKEIEESMGPVESKCPKSIIQLLSPTTSEYAQRWRQRCLDNAKTAQEGGSTITKLNKLPVYTIIQFEIDGKTVMLQKKPPSYQFKTPYWYDGVYYWKKKNIPEDFKIIEKHINERKK